MIIVNHIRESEVNQGDLVYICHWSKPYKSGWWRQVRCSDVRKGEDRFGKVCYVLEIPTHEDYKDNQEDGSRRESGTYLMTQETVRKRSAPNIEIKYEILACLKGVTSVIAPSILKNDMASLLRLKDIQDDRSLITKHYKSMTERYYSSVEQINRYERLTDELV